MKYLSILFAILLITGCAPNPEIGIGQIITVKEGQHRSTPYHLTWNDDTNIIYQYSTNTSWVYELGDENQCDWNKLGGYSMHFHTNHKNSVMVGVRYDRSGKILLSPYYHHNDSTTWVSAICTPLGSEDDQPDFGPYVITVDVGDSFEVHWTLNDAIDYTSLTIITDEGVLFWDKWWEEDFERTREIGPHFGGTYPAPDDWRVYRRLVAVE